MTVILKRPKRGPVLKVAEVPEYGRRPSIQSFPRLDLRSDKAQMIDDVSIVSDYNMHQQVKRRIHHVRITRTGRYEQTGRGFGVMDVFGTRMKEAPVDLRAAP